MDQTYIRSSKSLNIYMLLAMFSWAIAWTNAKIVSDYLSFFNLIFFRFLVGCITIYPFIYKKNNLSVLTFKNFKYILPCSLIFFIYNVFFFMGTHYGYAGQGAVLVTTLNPIITFIIMSIIKRKINSKDIIGIVLGIVGGLFIMGIFSNGGFLNIFKISNLFFLLCAISWGINTVITNYGQKEINSYQFIFFCYFITTIISLPFTNITEIVFSNLDSKFYLNFFLVSVGAMSFGTSIYMFATPRLGPIKASVFIYSVPFLALVTANLFLDEPITLSVIIGGLLKEER